MKRKFVKRNEDEERYRHPGFVSAANISHPDDVPTEVGSSNQCSKTWRAFFERIHDEENVTMPAVVANSIQQDSDQLIWPQDGGHNRSYSAIFNRMMGSTRDNSSFIDSHDGNRKDDKLNDVEDNGVYSVFTKKVSKNAMAPEMKQPAIYSPPKFSSNSTHRSVSKPSTAGRQPLFSKPYALSTNSRVPSTKSKPSTATTYNGPTTSASLYNSSLLPEPLRGRPLLIFSVLYSASSTRKHKKWESDGFLYFDFFDNQLCLHKLLEKPAIERQPTARIAVEMIEEEYVPGYETIIGNYEVQIQEKYYSNVSENAKNVEDRVKNERSNDEEERLAQNRAEIEDDLHFFDKHMEDCLMKIEEQDEVRGEALQLNRSDCPTAHDDSRRSSDSSDRQQSDTSTYSVDREIKIEDE